MELRTVTLPDTELNRELLYESAIAMLAHAMLAFDQSEEESSQEYARELKRLMKSDDFFTVSDGQCAVRMPAEMLRMYQVSVDAASEVSRQGIAIRMGVAPQDVYDATRTLYEAIGNPGPAADNAQTAEQATNDTQAPAPTTPDAGDDEEQNALNDLGF